MNQRGYLLLALLIILGARIMAQSSVSSPDRSTRLEIGVDKGKLRYRVFYAKKEVTAWSDLGFEFETIKAGTDTRILSALPSTHAEHFAWPLGESDSIDNSYSAMTLLCQSAALQFHLISRVYNGSVAFRYEIPEQTVFHKGLLKQENTAFNFTDPYILYQYHEESVFSPSGFDTLTQYCDFPATLVNKGKLYVTIGEADNETYTKPQLKKGDTPNGLKLVFVRDSAVKVQLPFQTPWRTISYARTAIGLHDYSSLFLKLSPPPPAPPQIKAGKLIRAQLNTQSGLDCIDFAVKHNFRYILFDAGWYGREWNTISNPLVPIPAIDMPRVIQYGKENGIGVLLYVNYVGLRSYLDSLLPVYKRWGVTGLKFGFVDGLTQEGLTWLSTAIKKVNDSGFVLDIHDNYKPTGLSRTWPALLTQEGVRGDENSPDAFHTTVLPFTRFLAGPADFTFCYPNGKNSYSKNLKVSKAQQLALTVIYYSPLQSIFWYGQPKDYANEEEIEFFTKVPTVWNETHYLAGEPGENISVARRKGDTWYVGSASGPSDWNQTIRLDFLTAGKTYQATMYEDDGQGSIKKRTQLLKKDDPLTLDIKAKGGQAIILSPKTASLTHPGILHSQKQFDALYKIVQEKTSPAYGSYLLLKNNPRASADYKMNGPYKTISRDGEFGYTKTKMETDFSAAYLNAIMWMVTKDSAHAKRAVAILTAYADTLTTIPSTNDAPLLAGLEGFKIIYATEVLRYTYKGMTAAQLEKITKMITGIFLPVLDNFYATPPYTNGNWGAIVTKTYMAAAIFLNDETMYRKAIDFFYNANDNGTIENYISGVTGQIQESGRDQGHSQLGIGALATICEEAWLQGDDLYSAEDNRLLRGFEYVARYNLGDDSVPFITWKDVTGKYSSWTSISAISRGKFIPVYEMVYHHYVGRKGLAMPYTQKVIEKIRPEDFDRDQPAFGTFLFSGQ